MLQEVSCEILPGQITAIIGPNGAGKSTLVRLFAGLRSADTGTIQLDQQDISAYKPQVRARRIAFLEQRPSLAFDFTVRRVIGFGEFASAVQDSRVDEALDRFELSYIKDTVFGRLSVGQQQRVAFARAWVQIHGCERGYLLADEPCSAMDPRHTIETMESMRALASTGIGVGIVIHDLNMAIRFAHRAIVLNQNGTLASHGAADSALDPQILTRVYGIQIQRHELGIHGPTLSIGDPG